LAANLCEPFCNILKKKNYIYKTKKLQYKMLWIGVVNFVLSSYRSADFSLAELPAAELAGF
jgi:hypothetical protein